MKVSINTENAKKIPVSILPPNTIFKLGKVKFIVVDDPCDICNNNGTPVIRIDPNEKGLTIDNFLSDYEVPESDIIGKLEFSE